jgi:hypothetical protein
MTAHDNDKMFCCDSGPHPLVPVSVLEVQPAPDQNLFGLSAVLDVDGTIVHGNGS